MSMRTARGRTRARLPRRHRLCSALAALTCAAALPVAADEIVWNGSQSQDWFNGLNWTPAAPPAPDDDAVIDTNQPNGPNVIGAAALLRDLTVGRSGSATLQIAGVGGMSSRIGRIGELEGSVGAVIVAGAGSVWNNSQHLSVGLGGTGSLNVINGGQVFSSAAGIGQQQGSDGSALISGPGSTWANAGALIVGDGGSGALFIINGAEVTNGQARIGQGVSGQGIALVSGAGSTWTSVGTLVVGNSGSGSMEILDGGAVVSTSGTVGNLTGSVGEVVVEGLGSHWSMASDLSIGAQGGTGTLRVQDGGAVFSDAGFLGHFSGSGTATLTGVGSNWIMTGDLTVGRAGIGVLDITGGAGVASVGGIIGELSESTGVVTVSGAGSVWDYAGSLTIGSFGDGSLAIADGGQVINGGLGNALVAAEDGSTGTVVVSGAGTGWNLGNGGLYVGFAGSGTMRVEDGAAVSNGFAMIGGETGAPGTMTVTGGSQWASLANIVVGSAGVVDVDDASVVTGASFGFIDGSVSLDGASQLTLGGNLVVRDGGAIEVLGGSMVAADLGQVDGEASLAGAGSGLNLASNLFVGQTGTGTVRIADGGSLTSAGGTLGHQAGAEGAVTVHGAGSTWLNSAELEVGRQGAGTLAIEAGGAVANSTAEVGAHAGAQGAVTVVGPGSTWGNLGSLTIGEQGSGSLAVGDGGVVTSGTGVIGRGQQADGSARLEGDGSHWSIGTSLIVGGEGTGTLEIADGATVLQFGGAGILGQLAGGHGEVVVTGPGARWDSPGALLVGLNGSGSLAVLDGAEVTNADGAVGSAASGEGAMLVSGAGSLWTTTGQYAVGGDGAGTLTVADGGAVHSNVAILAASAGSTGNAVVTGAGTLWQTQSSLTVGSGGSGTLVIEDGGTVATGSFSWVGNQVGSEGAVTVRGAGSVWNPAGFITLGRDGAGTLTLTGDGAVETGGAVFVAQQPGSSGTLNVGAGAGEDAAAPGTLQASAIVFGDGEATLNFNHTHADYGFLTPMTSAGGGIHAIAHLAGTTVLGGDSAGFAGTTTVSGGTLAVDGVLGGTLYVDDGGTLAGTGTVGTTTVAAGGTLAPGASIGTLAVDGDVTFAPGSRFEVELDVAGNGDLLAVTGTATLDGGAVATLPVDGISVDIPYTILTGAGGVAGTFDSLTFDSPSAFLAPTLSYEPHAVVLLLLQGVSFASVALTPNQAAAGAGADSLGNGHPVWDAVVVLGEDDARDAFDALSGEIHASTLGALLDESRYVREAAHGRLHAAGDIDAAGFWARGFGGSGRIDGDGNAARLDRSAWGLFLGGDRRVGDGWRLGAALGYHRASHDADARQSWADVDSTHLAAYAGRYWGASALRLGAARAWHRIDVDRRADFSGFLEALQARYDASTLQVFAEYGHGIERGDFTWEPFAALAWVQVDGDRFDEGSGAAALSGDGGTHEATIATLGVRLAGRIDAGQASPATVRGILGWQRGFGDTTPRVRSAFAGGDPFVVAGAPAGGAAVIEAGLGFTVGARARLELSYAGRFGSDLRENAILATFSADF